jgi:hypothetical protein
VFGVTLWIITLPATLLPNFVHTNALVTFLRVPSVLVAIALIWLSGVRAAQRTGKARTGALAGMIVILIDSLLGTISSLTAFFVSDPSLPHLFTYATSALGQQIITGWMISFPLVLLEGAGIGAIGGLIGRRRAQLPLHV